jgi:hypothetical protein
MGLLEKALEYKKEINSRGRETIMDRIKGPAETEFLAEEDANPGVTQEPSGEDVLFLDENDLTEIVEEPSGAAMEEETQDTEISLPGEVPVIDELEEPGPEENAGSFDSSLESDIIDISALEETALYEGDEFMKVAPGTEIEDEMFILPDEDDGTSVPEYPEPEPEKMAEPELPDERGFP